jgi:hypothetical protein
MALGDSYATIEELKARFDGLDDTNDDVRLGEALDAASRGIDHFCGRQFNKATAATARVFPPTNRCRAEVDDFHTVTGLVVKTDAGNDGTYETTWASTDYQLEPLNGIVDGELGWPFSTIRAVGTRYYPTCSRRASLEVTAQWGWSAVPAKIKEATLVLAEDIFKLASTPFGVGGFGDFGRIRARENPHVVLLAGAYQRDAVLVA